MPKNKQHNPAYRHNVSVPYYISNSNENDGPQKAPKIHMDDVKSEKAAQLLNSIWVGNVPPNSESELIKMFSAFGPLSDPPVRLCKNSDGQWYSFVNFKSADTVDQVLKLDSNLRIGGSELLIRRSRSTKQYCDSAAKENDSTIGDSAATNDDDSSSQQQKWWSIYVGNVPQGSASELREMFSAYGTLAPIGQDIEIRRNLNKSKSDNFFYAFVNFVSEDSVRRILDQPPSNLMLNGHFLEIRESFIQKFQEVEQKMGENSKKSAKIYPSILIRNLPSAVKKSDLFNAFKNYGIIAEPPYIQIDVVKREAVVPFRREKDVDSALKSTKGQISIEIGKNRSFTLALEKFLYQDDKFCDQISTNSGFPTSYCSQTSNKSTKNRPFKPKMTKNLRTTDAKPKIDVPDLGESSKLGTEINQSKFLNESRDVPVILQARNVGGLSWPDFLKLLNFDDIIHRQPDEHENRCIIKCKNAASAETVLNKFKQGAVSGNQKICVSKSAPVSNRHFFFCNIPEDMSPGFSNAKSCNTFLIELFKEKLERVRYTAANNGALVTLTFDLVGQTVYNLLKDCTSYNSEPEVQKLVSSMRRVRQTDAIVVYGRIPGTDPISALNQALRPTLNKSQFGIGSINPVRYVLPVKDETAPNDETMLVIFENYEHVTRLTTGQQQHILSINGQQYRFAPYFDCMRSITLIKSIDRANSDCELFHFQLTPVQFEYLKQAANRESIVRELQSKKWDCKLTIGANNNAILYGPMDAPFLLVSDFVKTNIPFTDLNLDKPWKECIEKNFEKFKEHLKAASRDSCCMLTGNVVSLASRRIDDVIKAVIDFLNSNALYEHRLPLNVGQSRYLKKYCADQLTDLKSHDLTWSTDDGDWLIVKDTKLNVPKHQSVVDRLLNNVKSAEFDISNYPGIATYFTESVSTTDGECPDLKIIGNETETIILYEKRSVLSEMPNKPTNLGQPVTFFNAKSAPSNIVDRPSEKSAVVDDSKMPPNFADLPKIIALPLPDQPAPDLPTVLTINGTKIEMVKADMAVFANQCDVVVNSTSVNLVAGGALCKSLLKAGGAQLLADIRKSYPNGVDPEKVAITSGGALTCKKIYHVVCPKSVDLKKYALLIVECLDEARNAGMQSIAFPSLGTGSIGLSPMWVAAAMLRVIQGCLPLFPHSTLNNVYIVLYPSDTASISAFESGYKLLLDEENEKNHPKPVSTSSQIIASVRIGNNLRVSVVENDFQKETSHCFIVLTNLNMEFGETYVVDAVKTVSGPQLSAMLNNAYKLIYNNFSKFDGKYVSFFEVPGSPGEWVPVVRGVLDQVLSLRCPTCSILLLGTSKLCENFTEVVNSLLRAAQLFKHSAKQHYLNVIRIVVYQKSSVGRLNFSYNFDSAVFEHGSTTTSHNLHNQEGPHVLKHALNRTIENHSKEYFTKSSNLPNFTETDDDDPMVLNIYGPSDRLHVAKDRLESLCERKCPEIRLQNNVFEYLDEDMGTKLKGEAKKFGVALHLNQLSKEAKIRGYKSAKFREYFSDLLQQLSAEIAFAEKSVMWYKRLRNGALPGSVKSVAKWESVTFGAHQLENAFLKANRVGTVPITFEDQTGVVADFSRMTVLSSSRQELFDLKRRDKNDDIPLHWDLSGPLLDSAYQLIELSDNSDEYFKILQAVQSTYSLPILKIERVENFTRYKQYIFMKKSVEARLANDRKNRSTSHVTIIERNLFHGTDPQNVKQICLHGFNRSLAGRHGTNYGAGCYFAKDFTYSKCYGKTVFLCHVLTGQYCLGDPSMKVAPNLDPDRGLTYDSVVDNVSDPKIFVVFSDNHAYPAYLITHA